MDDIHLIHESGTRARIAPDSGFCCLSWQVDGREYLHLPVPEAEFRSKPKTGGVPLLYPYANRLRTDPWPDHPEVKRDQDLPCHGFLLRFGDWDDLRVESTRASACLDWSAHEDLMTLFPHAHRLEVSFEVGPRSLRVKTLVEADGDDEVPISFGWHPYLTLPGLGHDDLALRVPPLEHVRLDARGLPIRDGSGQLILEPADDVDGSLEGRTFDDLYRPTVDKPCLLLGGDAGIEVRLDDNWRFLQLYSPEGGPFACIEPMTAAVAALSDGRDHPTLAPGERFEAGFELSVLGPENEGVRLS
ncbi:MAG: aldose 1-epimerase [Phycisphaerales bacterium]|nr:aldose 1-epimerase [Phycisphaerales bacterium]